MLDYFSRKKQAPVDKGKAKEKTPEILLDDSEGHNGKHVVVNDPSANDSSRDPILNDDDEAFLRRILAKQGPPPPLPRRPGSSSQPEETQEETLRGAHGTPLPDAPDTPEGEVASGIEGEAVKIALKDKEANDSKKKNRFSWLRRSSSRSSRKADQTKTGDSLHDAAQKLKVPDGTGSGLSSGRSTPGDGAATPTEDDEIASVLDQLNLAAENNRVFSISSESKSLLKQFNLVLQDLINGVPTAYHDLESLLTNSDSQIQKSYSSLPPFLQELIEKLPEKLTGKLGVEGKEEKEEKQEKKKKSAAVDYLATGATAATKMLKVKVPSLKELLTKQGSVVALLRSIVAALRTRFPALMGMNAVWSVALFVLLFIFWYCHKRGRETRLERERKLTEQEMDELRRKVAADPAWIPPPGWNEGTLVTTRAPEGASIEEIHAGMLKAPEEAEQGEAEYAPDGSLAKAIKKDEV